MTFTYTRMHNDSYLSDHRDNLSTHSTHEVCNAVIFPADNLYTEIKRLQIQLPPYNSSVV